MKMGDKDRKIVEKLSVIKDTRCSGYIKYKLADILSIIMCAVLCGLDGLESPHVLIPPRTPWHDGKVERSHRNDQRYFYDWETFNDVDELNEKLREHLVWSNNKSMRTLGYKLPMQLLEEKLNK